MLHKKIRQDLIASMKAKDGTRVSVLRFLLASVKNREIEQGGSLDDDQVLAEIASSAKRRRESIEAFKEAEREDLVRKEEAELAILQEFLPDQLSPEEVEKIVRSVIIQVGARSPSDLGKVMSKLMPEVRGRADGKLVNRIVRDILSG